MPARGEPAPRTMSACKLVTDVATSAQTSLVYWYRRLGTNAIVPVFVHVPVAHGLSIPLSAHKPPNYLVPAEYVLAAEWTAEVARCHRPSLPPSH